MDLWKQAVGSASLLVALLAFGCANAASLATPLDVRAGLLSEALRQLSRETGVAILFDEATVRGRWGRALRGLYTPEQALEQLLTGSGVEYRRSADGDFVLRPVAVAQPDDDSDGAISEVLVVGRRTQNADIRRTKNDIQPYAIVGSETLALAPSDNLDQYFRDRFPANGQVASPAQYVSGGAAPNSAIDLRGAGTLRTLVLVDGQRLPGLPSEKAGFEQADLNAIPPGSIERIETLTGTAGGIHGPTAIGGVVNVVLKRDNRGADLILRSGLSSRGDAGHVQIQGRIGFSPNDGRTDVMVSGSYAEAQPLKVGQRDYARRSLERQAANTPDTYVRRPQAVDAIMVRSSSGGALRLDAALGGATLSSSFTYLPAGFAGDNLAKAATLAANSGELVTQPAPGLSEVDTTLVSTPRSASFLLNVRQRMSPWLEGFIDAIYLSSEARADFRGLLLTATTHADAIGNLFDDAVIFTFPTPGLTQHSRTSIYTRRTMAGLIATLPRQWQGFADLTVGRTVLRRERDYLTPDVDPASYPYRWSDALWSGLAGASDQPAVVPLGDYAALQAALPYYLTENRSRQRLTNDLTSVSLRAAGPIAILPGGPLTLTLLGEIRREHMPQTASEDLASGTPFSTNTVNRLQRVSSAYAELRAPLGPENAAFVLARRLELQLALRRDDIETVFPENVAYGALDSAGRVHVRHQSDVFTVGVRTFPVSWLMLRGSLATGQSPPTLQHLQEQVFSLKAGGERDPKRGGRLLADDGPFRWIRGGSHKVGQEKGTTATAGLVVNPSGRVGPRLSADTSRLEIRDELVPVQLPLQKLIEAEGLYPEQVEREPLSPADAALGYTAGRITALYAGYNNAGRTIAQTVDFQLDWPLRSISRGQARFYGAATWQPMLKSKLRRDGAWIDRAGYGDSPLKWRANAGLEWVRGPLTFDLNVQHLGGRKVQVSGVSPIKSGFVDSQGATRIPSQVYIDLVVLGRFDLPGVDRLQGVSVRVAIQNLLDRSPPIVADANNMGYDYRGDPRRRRFEMSLTARF